MEVKSNTIETTTTEFITPETAEYYFSLNIKNRGLNMSYVRDLADDMLNGKWELTHQGIAFNNEGALFDGQHRIKAIVLAKNIDATFQGVPLMVTRHANDVSRMVIDSGKTRTPRHVLAMEGFSYPGERSALAANIIIYNHNKGLFSKGQMKWKKIKISKADILDFCRKHDLTEYLEFSSDLSRKGSFVTKTLWSFTTWILFNIDKQNAEIFLKQLSKGVGLKESSPVLLLRDRLMENKEEKFKFNDFIALIYIIKTWNAWILGSNLGLLRYNSTEFFPEIKCIKE
jgi:hypothetical protein